MKALLIVAHGSRVASSNEQIRQLSKKIASEVNGYDLIDCAFLELTEPSIIDGCHTLIDAGATTINIIPYFLAAGKHVNTDIPDEVTQAAEANPTIDIHLMDYFGSTEGAFNALLNQVESSHDH